MYAVREDTPIADTPDPVDSRVGRRIWQRRREVGLSRRALGELIGIGLKQVNKYEMAVNRVSAGRLFDIAAALGVTPAHFFEGIEDGPAGNPGLPDDAGERRRTGNPREIRALVDCYHKLTPEIRSRFLRLVRVIADGG